MSIFDIVHKITKLENTLIKHIYKNINKKPKVNTILSVSG